MHPHKEVNDLIKQFESSVGENRQTLKVAKRFNQLLQQIKVITEQFFNPIHKALYNEAIRLNLFQYTPTLLLDFILPLSEVKKEFKARIQQIQKPMQKIEQDIQKIILQVNQAEQKILVLTNIKRFADKQQEQMNIQLELANQNFQEQIDMLQNQIKEKKLLIEELELSDKKIQYINQQLQLENMQFENTLNILQKQNKSLLQVNQDQQLKLTTLQQQNNQLKEDQLMQKQECDNIKCQSSELIEQQATIQRLYSSEKQLQLKIQQKDELLLQRQKEFQQLSASIKLLTEENQQLNEKIANSDVTTNLQKCQIDNILHQIRELEGINEQYKLLQKQMYTINDRNTQLQHQINRNSNEMVQKSLLQKVQVDLNSEKEIKQQLQKQLEIESQKQVSLLKLKQQLKNEYESQIKAIEAKQLLGDSQIQQEFYVLKSENLKLKETEKETRLQMLDLQNQDNQLRQQLQEQKLKNQTVSENLQQVNLNLNSLTTQYQDQISDNQRLTQELQDKLKLLNLLKEKHQQCQQKVGVLQSENEKAKTIQSKFSDLEKKMDSLESKNKQLQNQIDQQNQEAVQITTYLSIQSQQQLLQEQNSILLGKNNELTQKYKQLEQDYEIKKQSYASKIEVLQDQLRNQQCSTSFNSMNSLMLRQLLEKSPFDGLEVKYKLISQDPKEVIGELGEILTSFAKKVQPNQLHGIPELEIDFQGFSSQEQTRASLLARNAIAQMQRTQIDYCFSQICIQFYTGTATMVFRATIANLQASKKLITLKTQLVKCRTKLDFKKLNQIMQINKNCVIKLNPYAYRHYYQQLPEELEECLVDLLFGLCNFRQSIYLSQGLTQKQVQRLVDCVRHDFPEIFYGYHNSLTSDNDNIVFLIKISHDNENLQANGHVIYKNIMIHTDAMLKMIERKIKNLRTTLDVEMAIHHMLAQTIKYVHYSEKDQTLESVLIDQTTVCAGYALAFLYFCQIYDIPCIYVYGQAQESDKSKSEGHAWNKVNIDGDWTIVDVTWDKDETENSYQHMNLPDNQLRHEETTDYNIQFPPAITNKYNFLVINKQYIGRKSEMKSVIRSKMLEGYKQNKEQFHGDFRFDFTEKFENQEFIDIVKNVVEEDLKLEYFGFPFTTHSQFSGYRKSFVYTYPK